MSEWGSVRERGSEREREREGVGKVQKTAGLERGYKREKGKEIIQKLTYMHRVYKCITYAQSFCRPILYMHQTYKHMTYIPSFCYGLTTVSRID